MVARSRWNTWIFRWTTFAGIALGIGLAAATGFRVFLPLLVAGLAAHFGYIPLSENFQWLASTPALVMLGTAAAAEILAYYIPGVDHALDVVASPATLVAGAVASAAVMTDLPPSILWPRRDHRRQRDRRPDQGQLGAASAPSPAS